MPVNPAEQRFFKTIANENDQVFDVNDINAFRADAEFFHQYTGKPAEIPTISSTIKARDGYNIPIRIYHHELKNAPVLIAFPGCGYIVKLFEPNAIAYSRVALYAG